MQILKKSLEKGGRSKEELNPNSRKGKLKDEQINKISASRKGKHTKFPLEKGTAAREWQGNWWLYCETEKAKDVRQA